MTPPLMVRPIPDYSRDRSFARRSGFLCGFMSGFVLAAVIAFILFFGWLRFFHPHPTADLRPLTSDLHFADQPIIELYADFDGKVQR